VAEGACRARLAARGVRPAAWAAGLVPLALLVRAVLTGGLGVEPIEAVTHRTGFGALSLLMASLAVTPLRRLTGWNSLAAARRPLGLSAFGYAVLHLVTYLFDQAFSLAYVVEDVVERPHVTAGFLAFLLLVPLALTSTRGAIRRMGRGWQKLHRLVYLAAGLAVLHFLWLVKADLREPLVFAALLAVLMLLRLPAASWSPHRRSRDV
jgi:methionine sulfoxide reductase heme-binding subunit